MFFWNEPIPFFSAPDDPDPGQLSRLLMEAIHRGDIKAARNVYDTAFWNKVNFQANALHVLAAILRQDQDILDVLVRSGLRWIPEDAAAIQQVLPHKWPEIEACLKRAQLNIGENDVPVDIYAAALIKKALATPRWSALLSQKDRISEVEASKALFTASIDLLRRGDVKRAATLLNMQREKDGMLDLSRHFCAALQLDADEGKEKTFKHFDRLIALLNKLQPLHLDSETAWRWPKAVIYLHNRKMLHPRQPSRGIALHMWLNHFDEARILESHRFDAAQILFRQPLSDSEAVQFMQSYADAARKNPAAAQKTCETLMLIGFFNQPVWTGLRLRLLEIATPADFSVKPIFNKRVAVGRFGKMRPAEIMDPANLNDFLKAHKNGYYCASLSQAGHLLAYLSACFRQGGLPANTIEVLRTLKDCGVRFYPAYSAFHERDFHLAAKEPGLAKILLELDILRPRDFSMENLIRKAGLPKNALQDDLYWHQNKGPYTEFLCQVYLELNDAAEYIPQRGKISSYHQAFRDRLVKKRGSPPPPPPEKGFWRGLFR